MTNKERFIYEIANLTDCSFNHLVEELVCPECDICPASLERYCDETRGEHACIYTVSQWLNYEYNEKDGNLIKENLDYY